jgi:hypothetical protein
MWINERLAAQSADGVLPLGKVVEVQAANVDHKIVLRVDGKRLLKATSAEWQTTPDGDVEYQPRFITQRERRQFEDPAETDPARLAAEVNIGAGGGAVNLGYLRLDRDVYYLNDTAQTGRSIMEDPGRGSQGNPFTLEAGEYFMCGDNSPRSLDSRLWSLLERPVVPHRNLVGKAFFVYWPAAGKRWGIPIAPDPTGWRLVH